MTDHTSDQRAYHYSIPGTVESFRPFTPIPQPRGSRFATCVIQSGVEILYLAIKTNIADYLDIIVQIDRRFASYPKCYCSVVSIRRTANTRSTPSICASRQTVNPF